jgi:striatin 1/3/4
MTGEIHINANGSVLPRGILRNFSTGTSTLQSTSTPEANQPNPMMNLSLPKVLHFLQAEWRKFEMERNTWEIERSELQVRGGNDLYLFFF